jgi:pyruvate dehydrogenase E2 component (dihydrolipoamide acetyltransferase)
MGEFRMPSLGADMEAAVLIEWRVKVGDPVKRGDIIAEVTTDKGDIEVEVFEDGVVDQLVAQPGSKLPVGAVLAVIRGAGQAAPTAPVAPAAPAPPPVAPPAPKPQPAPLETHRIHASPLARKIAAELGIDLATISGTGPGGAIERADVERVAAQAKPLAPPTPAPAPKPSPVPIQAAASGMRRAIASAMARSNREIPHYYLQTRIDMSVALRWLEDTNAARPIRQRLLPAVLLLKAVAHALKETPDLNGYWHDDQLERRAAIHIGFAIASREGGLITPAIHDVQSKSLDEIMAALHDLIPRTRAGHLRSSELTDGTITVTNLGDLGVETVFGVIYPPQVALVGFGRIAEQAWARDGMLGVHPIMTATLAADHRATDGRTGGQFLDALNHLLQKPEAL